MGKFKDLTGQRFGRLVVIHLEDDYVSPSGYHKKRWLCHCDCGNDVIVWSGNLINSHTQSCGCQHLEKIATGNTKHGIRNTRVYRIWTDIITRCENPNSEYYGKYGGRGIKMCDEWRNDPLSFYEWSIANGYADGLSIDRKNNDGNYEPSNCRWSNRVEQANNTSRNHYITYKDKTMTIAQWARETGLSNKTIADRLALGWDVESALTTTIKAGNRYKNIKSTPAKKAE